MQDADFVVVGSSGGGGTIAWLLGKAGFKVVVLEQGPDWAKQLDDDHEKYNPGPSHDEYRYRLDRPDRKRRPRGDYNTFRAAEGMRAAPFGHGWTGSVLGGGSLIWGTWAFRAAPIDFRLGTHFRATAQEALLKEWGYSVPDWPIEYREMEPYYNVAETLLAVSGDRESINEGISNSPWYQEFGGQPYFRDAGNWEPTFPFPCPAYPRTPVGQFIYDGMQHTPAGHEKGLYPFPLPSAMVAPGTKGFKTREAIAGALKQWNGDRPEFWKQDADDLWSQRVRDACNMCGFCGEYLCWGKTGPKSGTRVSTLKEIGDLPNVEVRTDARAYEVVYDDRLRRATGVRYLDVSDPEDPRPEFQKARYVIVSCGAVQSARLLLMSGPPGGLGNRYGQIGRYATFHLFGYAASCTLRPEMQGYLASQLGHTGNVASFAHYFVKDDTNDPKHPETAGKWWKAGTIVSTALKNPLENAVTQWGKVRNGGSLGVPLLKQLELYPRSLQLRLTGDDLPMATNRVDLDPHYVDEYGFPAARITRSFGRAEETMFRLMSPKLRQVFQHYQDIGLIKNINDENEVRVTRSATLTLIGDHQHGTCRMGDDPAESVVDRYCRMHDVRNVFVVDSSFMPTGLGLNPMVTVVANALRVGTWIVDQTRRGTEME